MVAKVNDGMPEGYSNTLKQINHHWFTRSLVPGQRIYGERILKEGNIEWREWNPFRSKLAAALASGWTSFPIREGHHVLYLGCAEGTTVSHVSDIVGKNGLVVGVDISPQAMVKFTALAETRTNILPLLGDAANPSSYAPDLDGLSFQIVVQDISQRNQGEIFLRNMRLFGTKGTEGALVIKARSIDFAADPAKVFEGERIRLQEELTIIQTIPLGRFEKDHFLIHSRKPA
ncbi:MAG: fibrillarin-like rRNA/tRNA 2'-O-methyltransferase [Candidatus Diapherotrites archaeon]|nr:fibrillarin-like rRNA/tRNA 2'-O-methyltransferase [Candidatus Diapherotrites archaeon]MDZ4256046.1 fibrillarin-like rRNA/tRNA 2'-O-methyltransferase [archaeon]